MTNDVRLPFDPETRPGDAAARPVPDAAARRAAVDPRRNIVLEASAGTGKTRVLVDRYLNLLRAGVDPRNILAMTFTRKAAAEMRQRIVDQLRAAALRSPEDAQRWRGLRDRLNEIAISTIDAFCLALLREFPLEADLDPGFDIADQTEVPRLVEESLDQTLRICRARARTREDIALLFAELGEPRLRAGLAALLERRIVAASVLRRVLPHSARRLTVAEACRHGVERVASVLTAMPGGVEAFLDAGPVHHARFAILAREIRALIAAGSSADPDRVLLDPAGLRGRVNRLQAHFFTQAGTPRKKSTEYRKTDFPTSDAARAHWATVTDAAPQLERALRALRRDLNGILARGVWHAFGIALDRYRRTLETHGVLDFGELLVRTQALLGNMDEFARSRYLLEARYHHVLVDEFQDTSRAQWELVSLLVRTWSEGIGLSHDVPLAPSIFIVGDRKQSIYGFRDAEGSVLDEAASAVAQLRPDDDPLKSISNSFRSVAPLLAFANDVFADIEKAGDRPDAFRYDERDAFPVTDAPEDAGGADPAVGVIAADDVRTCAAAVAAEIARLAAGATVRDRQSGMRRDIRPADIAILFRSRESHREFEAALEARGILTYVYKGLGFFEAGEVRDLVALVRYLAEPSSDLRAAAFLRSRVVRLSDPGIQRLSPGIAGALTSPEAPARASALDSEDARVLARLRASLTGWLDLADRVPPADVVDQVLRDCAYDHELRGPRVIQARENVKKIRGLIRRIQNRGYLTLSRLAGYLDRLAVGDESNAVVDAIDAVNLMTVHAAKGLEFPVVFVVNLSRGTGGHQDPIRLAPHADPDDAIAVGDFHTEFDDDARAKDREETKRLLYVALTRARDRLYLASATERGAFRPRMGSLGEVLPHSVGGVFTRAAAAPGDGSRLEWMSAGGRRHEILVCANAAAPRVPTDPFARAAGAGAGDGQAERLFPPPDDFGPIIAAAAERVAVTALGREAAAPTRVADRVDDGARVVVGRLVHRLFQRGARGDDEPSALVERARRLLTQDERDTVESPERAAADAARVFARMWVQPEVRAALDQATCLYEVPISIDAPDGASGGGAVILRGVIDCLALRPDGSAVVLDFKTGAPRDADQRQLDAYVEAARGLCPGATVTGRLVYPGPPDAGAPSRR